MSEVNLVPRHETEHPRRAFLTDAAAAGAAALLVGSGRAFAALEKEPGHTHSWAYGGVMQAATTCMGEGHVCLNHCLNSFRAGDNSLIACGVAVQETIAACSALAQLAASNSTHTKAFAGPALRSAATARRNAASTPRSTTLAASVPRPARPWSARSRRPPERCSPYGVTIRKALHRRSIPRPP